MHDFSFDGTPTSINTMRMKQKTAYNRILFVFSLVSISSYW